MFCLLFGSMFPFYQNPICTSSNVSILFPFPSQRKGEIFRLKQSLFINAKRWERTNHWKSDKAVPVSQKSWWWAWMSFLIIISKILEEKFDIVNKSCSVVDVAGWVIHNHNSIFLSFLSFSPSLGYSLTEEERIFLSSSVYTCNKWCYFFHVMRIVTNDVILFHVMRIGSSWSSVPSANRWRGSGKLGIWIPTTRTRSTRNHSVHCNTRWTNDGCIPDHEKGPLPTRWSYIDTRESNLWNTHPDCPIDYVEQYEPCIGSSSRNGASKWF